MACGCDAWPRSGLDRSRFAGLWACRLLGERICLRDDISEPERDTKPHADAVADAVSFQVTNSDSERN